MTEPDPFEARLRSALLRYTNEPVAVDSAALAHLIAAASRSRPSRGFDRGLVHVGRPWRLAFLLILALVISLLGGLALVGSGLVGPSLPVVPHALGSNGLIAFCRGRSDAPDTRVHVMGPDGSGERELVTGAFPEFSADGSVLTYLTGWPHDTTVFVADPDGSNPRLVPDLGGDAGPQEHALSPDGTMMAWLDRRHPGGRAGSIRGFRHPPIRITPLDGSPVRRLTTGSEIPDPYATGLTWAPDGRSIAFGGLTDLGDGAYRSSIFVVDVASGDVRRVSARPGPEVVAIAWSPDSRRLAFTALPVGAAPSTLFAAASVTDIVVIRADGTEERDVAEAPDIQGDLAWSPDGERIAFLASGASGFRIRILTLGGATRGSEAVTGPEAEKAIWSPDGSMILFDTSGGTIFAVDSGFRGPPVKLAGALDSNSCLSWQRVER
jgi:Tol biopolymer transport system component